MKVPTVLEWGSRLSSNGIAPVGFSTLIPGRGFRQLYNQRDNTVKSLFSGFMEVVLTF